MGIAESELAQVQEIGEDAVVGKVEGCDFAGWIEPCPFWRRLSYL